MIAEKTILIDYGKDVIKSNPTKKSLTEVLKFFINENYSLSKLSDVQNGIYKFVPNGGMPNLVFVRAEEETIEFCYTSPNGKELSKGLVDKLREFSGDSII